MVHRKLLIAVLIGTSLFMPCAQSMYQRNPGDQTRRDEFDISLDILEKDKIINRQGVDTIRRGNWNQLYNDYKRANEPMCWVAAIIGAIAVINYFIGTE